MKNSLFYLLISFQALCIVAISAIGCLDEDGSHVDWFVALKQPNSGSYVYADANSTSFRLSSHQIDDSDAGSIGNTLNQIFDNLDSSDLAYIIYNDELPNGTVNYNDGHMKGALAYDASSGFWLVHSVPKFPGNDDYAYPSSGYVYGQSFLCLSVDTATFNNIGSQLYIDGPTVYVYNLPSGMSFPTLTKIVNGEFNTEPQAKATDISTLAGQEFVVFAKNEQWDSALYDDYVEPFFKLGFEWETWQGGEYDDDDSENMPNVCNTTQITVNVQEVTLPSLPMFTIDNDHSKWGLSLDSGDIFCVGDINRQYSQAKRGGGTVCTKHEQMWKSFESIVTQAGSC